jgi:hypothetical protein
MLPTSCDWRGLNTIPPFDFGPSGGRCFYLPVPTSFTPVTVVAGNPVTIGIAPPFAWMENVWLLVVFDVGENANCKLQFIPDSNVAGHPHPGFRRNRNRSSAKFVALRFAASGAII